MLAIKKVSPEPGIVLVQTSEPLDLQHDEVLIEVKAAGICGSDVHVYQWTPNYDFMRSSLPVTLGHEFSGVVAGVGSAVTAYSIGDAVVAMPTTTCMRCSNCYAGDFARCSNRKTTGLTRDGAFARFVKVPARSCIALKEGTDFSLAALIEPLAVGDGAVQVSGLSLGDIVVVLGPGTIGQAMVRSASWRGAGQIISVGFNDPERLAVCRKMGASYTIDLADEPNLSEAVLSRTNGQKADVVLEATGNPSSITDGLPLLRRQGVYVAGGIHPGPSNLDTTTLVRNALQLRGAHGSRRQSWEMLVQRIWQEPEALRPMVSVEMPLSDAQDAFKLCIKKTVSKVILQPSCT
jgi:threonine dehydrogenase-like Zn-dependent dehydrogenase